MSNKKAPEARFRGFSDDWKLRKFSEQIKLMGGATPSKSNKDYWNGNIVWLSSQEIKDKYISKGTYNITEKAILENKTKMIPAGTPLIVIRSGILAKKFPLSIPLVDVAINQDIKALIFDFEKIQIDFLVAGIQAKESYILKNIVKTGTTVQSINIPDLQKMSIAIPNYQEQQKIGSFFKQLDDTIALHERKNNLLKQVKQGYLQKMFPKAGEIIPEVRFANFDGVWMQRKIGEFLSESKVKGSRGDTAKKLTVKLWRKGIIPKEVIYKGSSATQYYVRRSGQFMYGKLDFLNQAFGIVPLELDGYESTLDSPAFDFKNDIDPIFFLEYISLKRFYKYQGNRANGSRRAKRIHTETFFEMPIPIPSYVEQKKDGSFFCQLDEILSLYERKLNDLYELKNFLLKKMFI